MKTLISLTLSLSLLSGFYTNLSTWILKNETKKTKEFNIDLTENRQMLMLSDSVKIKDASLIEGNTPSGVNILKFVVERTADTTDFTVDFMTMNLTARGGPNSNKDADYMPVGGSIRFVPARGVLTDTIKVPVYMDATTELDEQLKVQLTAINNTIGQTVIGDSTGLGNIINNDTSYLFFRDTMLVEGNVGKDSLHFLVNMKGELDTMFQFNYMTMDRTATQSGGDYLSNVGIGTGSGSGTGSGTGVGNLFFGLDTIGVQINGDTKVEKDETLKLVFSNIIAGGRALLFMNNDSLSIGTIKNNDAAQISIADASILETDTGTDTLRFKVTTTNPVDSLGIVYMTMDSTATAIDTDFVPVVDTIYMHCLTSSNIKIAVKGDKKLELNEYLKVKLIEILPGDRAVTFKDSLAVGTIINDDKATLSINDIAIKEGNAGNTIFNFTVTLDFDLEKGFTVDYATCDSTATAGGNDYLAKSGTLKFTGIANEKKTISINVMGDNFLEIDELFKVKLSNIIGGTLPVAFADSIGIGTIINDDLDLAIIDPCECLNNESSPGAKDGQFAETVSVTSNSGQNWSISAVNGLYLPISGTFPPAKGGTPYPLILMAVGQQLTQTNLGNGLSTYNLQGIHIDGSGYSVTVTNGIESRTIGNTCYYESACGTANKNIVIPFFPNASGRAKIEDCKADNKFISDGNHLYNDDAPRNNKITICPNAKGQILTISFQKFDLAIGDTLSVYDGDNTAANLIAKASGSGVSQFNGGWVSSNCDPSINATGCLTFLFTTNGDNKKGTGWEATVNCALGVTTLNRPADVFAAAKCDSLTTSVNLRMPTISRSAEGCTISNDSIIFSYCDVVDTMRAGQLSFPIFPFGVYRVDYKLLADTTITTFNNVHVSVPTLACNDTVITAIGQGCTIILTPDDLLEDFCEVNGSFINQTYRINVKTDKGPLVGTGPNYPILDATKDGNVTCNTFYDATVYRILEVSKFGCSKFQIDSCTVKVKLIDGIKPVFLDLENDTILGCHDMTLTSEVLPKPRVVDNCEIDRVEATIPPNPAWECFAFKTIEVLWTAYDVCGNFSTTTQNITIRRPDKLIIPKDTMLNCTAILSPDSIGWPKIDANGDGIGNRIITDKISICNFDLIYKDDTIPATCSGSMNILRIYSLFDNCKNSDNLVTIDTQYILIRDTIAPIFDCPKLGTLGSVSNPYKFNTPYNSCMGAPGLIKAPSGTDACGNNLTTSVTGVYRIVDNKLVAKNLTNIQPLEVGAYRAAYQLSDGCGNNSEVCYIYFNIADQISPTAICSDELIVSLAYGDLEITAADINNGSYDACEIDTMFIRRTICGSETEYPSDTNQYVANKFGTFLDANAWTTSIKIGCCDINTNIKVQLLIFDKSGNYNKCWLTISPENQPQSVCGNLPDAEGFCDNYATNFIGQSTDRNDNNAFDDNEWQPIDLELLDVINTQFGNPACNTANTVCLNSSIEQEYQLLRKTCGVQTMRRRFRTRSDDTYQQPWYHQNITIKYRPGWSFTFPADTILQCGTTDVGNIPEMLLQIEEGTCDLIGWEVKDEVFETEDGSCFKILRQWFVLNDCQSPNVQQPFKLPRDQVDGKVNANAKRTFSSTDTIAGTPLNTRGYFNYTQLIIVMDNQAPIITIPDVDTCIVGVDDAAPFSQADVTPGTAPYECDTVRLFTATGLDCTAENLLDFRYEVFDEGVRVSFGEGSYIFHVVQPNRNYRVRFTASDNCGNIGSAERTFTFSDCKNPTAICQGISLNLNSTQTSTVSADDINTYSYDNCTDTSNIDLRIWHPALGVSIPSNISEVLALPTQVTLNCQNLGRSTANLYVVDEARNYDFCSAEINLTDNLNLCPAIPPRPFIAGRIQTTNGDMVEQVQMFVTGTGEMPEMITTDNRGTFNYQVEKGANYTIRPKKNINPLNGVTTFDLVLIQKHILGLQAFDSPYHYIAADVNQSGAVTAFDMVIARKLILHIITEFPNNESWKFVNMEYPMTATNPLINGYEEAYNVSNINTNVNIEFMAVKVGDVNGNAKPNTLVNSEERSFNGTIDLHLKDQRVEVGKTYLIDFTVNNLTAIEGYQFTLQYDGLTFNNWEKGIITEDYFGFTLAEKGFITTSWNKKADAEFSQKEKVFTLRFTATESGLLSEMIEINSSFTEAEGYSRAEELLAVKLMFDEITATEKTFELYQNRPNPFKQVTEINFYLPKASKTTLSVMDVAGKVVKTITGNYGKGEHTIVLNRRDLPANGLLYYQLESSAGKMTKTMLVLD